MGKQLLTGNVSEYGILWRNGHSMICTSVVPVAFRPFMPCPSFLPSTRLHFCIHAWALQKSEVQLLYPFFLPVFFTIYPCCLPCWHCSNYKIRLSNSLERQRIQENKWTGGGRNVQLEMGVGGELERIAKFTFLWQTAFNLVQWPREITAFPWAAALMLVFSEGLCSMRKSGRFWQNYFQRLLVELVSQLGLHADISHV